MARSEWTERPAHERGEDERVWTNGVWDLAISEGHVFSCATDRSFEREDYVIYIVEVERYEKQFVLGTESRIVQGSADKSKALERAVQEACNYMGKN